MAQTKRRRRSKHRGTAAGTIQSRGRTGRKPTGAERTKSKQDHARDRRTARLEQPPTWRGALTRAAIAAAIFLVALLVLFRRPLVPTLMAAMFALAIYVPMGYYTDLFLYRRRQKRKTAEAQRRRERR